jgi:DNA-binding transcriptional MerR regulator
MLPTTMPRQKLPHGQKAVQLGVSTRTLDRWIADGILPPPDRVNGRKYHDIAAEPRRIDERDGAAA